MVLEPERRLIAELDHVRRGRRILHWVSVGENRKVNRWPSVTGDVAIAATGAEATDPAQGDAERDAWGADVDHLPLRHAVLFHDKVIEREVTDGAAKEGAVEHEAAVPEFDDFPKRPTIEAGRGWRGLPGLDDEDEPPANDAGDEQPDRQVRNEVAVDALPLAQAFRQPLAEDERQEQHR